MQNQQETRRIPLGAAVGLSVAILAAGSGGAWWAWNSMRSSPPGTAPTVSQSPQAVQPSTEQKIQVYWIDDVDGQLELVPSSLTLEASDNPGEVLERAFNHLLTGPTDAGVATTIPEGTTLRNIAVESDGVHIDLSEEFTTGGGSASMQGRLAQVLYTATSLDPSAQVWIDVEGQPLEVLGGEGIVVEQPMTRQDFEENNPL